MYADDGPSLRAPFLRQFYPGVADEARATVIELGVGEAREGLDFTLTPLRESAINGVVVDENEHPVSGVSVYLRMPGNRSRVETLTTSDEAGRFHLRALTGQTYLLTAGGPLWSRREMTVTVGDDVAFVRVVLRPRGT